MEDVQDFDGIALNSVGDDVRGEDDLSGQGDATGTAAFGELLEALAAVPDALGLGEHDFSTGVLCQVGSYPFKVLERDRRPAYLSRRQRSGPTWRKRPSLRRCWRNCRHRPGQCSR